MGISKLDQTTKMNITSPDLEEYPTKIEEQDPLSFISFNQTNNQSHFIKNAVKEAQ